MSDFHLGAQNDALYIVHGKAPAASNDYPDHDADRTVVAKVYDENLARHLIVSEAENAALKAQHATLIELQDKTLMALAASQDECAALKEENERLKDDLVSNMIAKEEHIAALEDRCATAESEVVRLDRQNNAIKARVAELKGLVRDIRQHDIDETAKQILDGGRKFNFSLPLNIRERIAYAIKEPANEG